MKYNIDFNLLLTIIIMTGYFLSGCEENETSIIENTEVIDIDGNVYKTVRIGSQVWMVENLKTTRLNDGKEILLIKENSAWLDSPISGYCWYDNDEVEYKSMYGALYNWHTVETGRLCPSGWHIPADSEWKELEKELGMTPAEANDIRWRGTDQGSQLAGNRELWSDGDLLNNSKFDTTGFSAIPGGSRIPVGHFDHIGKLGSWWTSTEGDVRGGWSRLLDSFTSKIYRFNYHESSGFSVRCIKD